MYPILQITKFFGRLYTRVGNNISQYKIVWLLWRSNDGTALVQTVPRLSSSVGSSLAAATASGLSIAHAQERQEPRAKDEHDGPTGQQIGQDWIANRVKSDICHLAPGISELLLDILDLMQDSYDRYINSMRKRVVDLESNLRKYGSTVSLHLVDADSQSLTDPGSKEIVQLRKDYRKTYQRSSEMLVGLDRFLLSAGELGANNCVEKCKREMREIRGLLGDLEHRIRDYENKLEMAEKHFRTKMRRAANGNLR